MDAEYNQLLTRWLRGNPDAQVFIDTLFDVLHVCDDLTDGDKPVPVTRIQEACWKSLIALPRNAFYVQHFGLLNGALQTAFLNWEVANRLEVSEEAHAKAIAFVLRSSYADLVTLCAWILGGHEWAITVGVESRLHAGLEGMDTYLNNLTHETRPVTVGGV